MKEQMRMRVFRTVEAETKVRVLTIGASEMSRIRGVWEKEGAGKVEVGEEIRIRGKLDRGEGCRLEEELERVAITPDRVVIAGPGNSLMEHEGRGEKGKTVKRVVRVKTDGEGRVVGLESEYHLCEPVRLTMCERKLVAQVLAGLVKKCRELWPLVEVYYLTMFPRHVEKCCNERTHMTSLDPQVIQTSRLDLEEDITDEIRRVGEKVSKLLWWSGLGLQMEPSLEWIRERGVVGRDGVHMVPRYIGQVAGLLCRRLGEEDVEEVSSVIFKKRRTTW